MPAPKPTTIDVDAMPDEVKRTLIVASWDFIREVMQDPVSKAKLDAVYIANHGKQPPQQIPT